MEYAHFSVGEASSEQYLKTLHGLWRHSGVLLNVYFLLSSLFSIFESGTVPCSLLDKLNDAVYVVTLSCYASEMTDAQLSACICCMCKERGSDMWRKRLSVIWGSLLLTLCLGSHSHWCLPPAPTPMVASPSCLKWEYQMPAIAMCHIWTIWLWWAQGIEWWAFFFFFFTLWLSDTLPLMPDRQCPIFSHSLCSWKVESNKHFVKQIQFRFSKKRSGYFKRLFSKK